MAGRIARLMWPAALAVAAMFADIPLPSTQAVAAKKETAQPQKPRLSQRRYYTLQPFTVPLMADGEINEQFTIVISLELSDEDNRVAVAQAVPRIRNEVYNELLHLVTFRRRGVPVPEVVVFKQQLLKIARRIVGDKVSALLVQQAFKAPLK